MVFCEFGECLASIASTAKGISRTALEVKNNYSQTCVHWPPLGPEKSGRLTEVPDKTEI